ncbi:RagB/SusD family nutrient uptake outer membrane protein [Prevotella melaninogenica]|uniref:RagB/SusD family nutrient uptake outer membrane protein n=1 Tax=Prevotella melaninogenica TaxID=28132 RepID=UPI001C602414|nr:RagB/SusD family nutrient uptake outer membrane protein [Prevotella melaninogenica]MBW4729143.1 RagB/SusD family nutrient uptake outer membrane protein [Prevotella melaninogenica]MBW4731889.1 RagB/SusD family nutrient uptake outer membrane protein [Prevotella melaninogenica]MBW4749898.1 RagB/SusD family nutrient uptake outer membrane protein [Prevotella melaninogenica]
MKIKNIIYKGSLMLASVAILASCSDQLDTLPDNRTTLDTPKKIAGLLVTAYPDRTPTLFNEWMSDNTDYMGAQNSQGNRGGDQYFFWQEQTEGGNDSPEQVWMLYYEGVYKANEALAAIDDQGGPKSDILRNSKGEALLLRAYNHFILANEFCRPYNGKTSTKDAGLYYATGIADFSAAAEQSNRGTVADVYAKIAADIEAGIPLLNDTYEVPKYHFNKQAAYAFATRFYLYYEKWEKAKEYADKLLGSNPAASLRDYRALQAMPLSKSEQAVKIAEAYCSASADCNLLVQTSISSAGMALAPWLTSKRYTLTNYLSETELFQSNNIWGTSSNLIWKPFTVNSGESNFALLMKLPREFEIRNTTTGSGYLRTLNVNFTMDEALLNRAEAEIMLGQNDAACADMTIWMKNFFNTNVTLTPTSVQTYFKTVPYAYADAAKMVPSFKKHISPRFTIDAEGSVQESLLQCLLNFRRIETVHQGMRWMDIRRYNIEIPRRLIGANGKPSQNLDWLEKDDPRQVVQIPQSIREAGVAGNPAKALVAGAKLVDLSQYKLPVLSAVNQYSAPVSAHSF